MALKWDRLILLDDWFGTLYFAGWFRYILMECNPVV